MEGAQHCGLSQLATEVVLDFGGGEHASAFEQLPDLGHQRGDARFRSGSALPVAIAAQCIDERQRLFADEKVGMIGGSAEQVQGQGDVSIDEAGEQFPGGLDGGARRSGIGLAQNGLDERGSRGQYLRLARQEEAETGLAKPRLRVFERQDGLALLPPQGGARCQ